MKRNLQNYFTYKKNRSKQNKKLQKGDKKITSDFKTVIQCQYYYQNSYTKSKTCNTTQKKLLQNLPNKVTQQQNEILTK